MRIGVIVQARMVSSRLPGKALMDLAGKPLLQYVLERLERCEMIESVVVATSTANADDVIVQFCQGRGTECYRGPLDNVAGRFRGVLEQNDWEAFVRVSGDSPLLDQRLVDRGVKLFCEGDFDLVTNVWPRSYPYGQSVEVVAAEILKQTYKRMKRLDDREHVTRFFYQHEREFKIGNFKSAVNYAGWRLAVDTADDRKKVEALVQRMTKPHWMYTVDELVKLATPIRL